MREEIMKPLCFLLGFIAAFILCEAAASHVLVNGSGATDTVLSFEPLKNTKEKKEKKIPKEKKNEKKKGGTNKEKKESPKPEKGTWAIAAAFQPLFYSSC